MRFIIYLALNHTTNQHRPGGECGNGPPTGKFMGTSGLGQFWDAEFENRWYTGNGWGLQPRFRDLMSRFGEKRLVHDSSNKQGKI